MDFRTLKPQASAGDTDAISRVLSVMRVVKVKQAPKVRRSPSSGRLGGQLASQDEVEELSAMEEVVNLEKSFEALRSLQDEVEAQA